MSKIFNFPLLIIALGFLMSCHSHTGNAIPWKQEDGYIPNESSAIKIAEIVWLNIYGYNIEDEKPFKVRLKDGNVWVVEGTLDKNKLGGVAYIEIQKSDGKILKVIHGK